MEKKEIIKVLKFNKKLAKGYLKPKHTEKFINETKGLIDGYDFAIILLKKE